MVGYLFVAANISVSSVVVLLVSNGKKNVIRGRLPEFVAKIKIQMCIGFFSTANKKVRI